MVGTVVTRTEREMLDRLNRAGKIQWLSCSTSETQTLNRLVKKGLAKKVDGVNGLYCWHSITE